MNQEQRKRIQKVWLKLIDNISNVDRIIDGLLQEEVLTRQLREKILASKTDTEKLRSLLDILPRRGEDAFEKFYYVLVENDEDTAADLLCPERAERRRAVKKAGEIYGPVLPKQESLPEVDEEDDELPKRWPDPNTEVHDPMRLKVEHVQPNAREMRAKFDRAVRAGTESSVYPMHRKVRGKFLLINNQYFKPARAKNVPLTDREGTGSDQLALDTLFKQLGFDVVIKPNLTAEEMQDAMEEQAALDHTQFDCFACAVLTHGEKGSIYGVDGELLELDKFKDTVDGSKCLTLIGKPKLFFIQACQGKAMDKGSGIGGGAGEAAPQLKKVEEVVTGKEMEQVLDKLTNVWIREQSDAATETTVPSKADVFVAMATVEDFVSWRSTNWGTFFVQAIAYVFARLSHKYELNQLMVRVNRLVGRAETRKKFKQISVFRNALTSEFYFFPGLQSTCTIVESHSEPDLNDKAPVDISVHARNPSSVVAQASLDDGTSRICP